MSRLDTTRRVEVLEAFCDIAVIDSMKLSSFETLEVIVSMLLIALAFSMSTD
jgi:hypothetical protein